MLRRIVILFIFICGMVYLFNIDQAKSMVVTKHTPLRAPLDKQVRELDLLLNKIVLALQGRIRFGTATDGYMGENIQGQFQVVGDTGTADTEFTVAHTLAYTPTMFLVLSVNKGGIVYKSTTSWTSSNVYFKSSVANASVTLFIF